jgi:hypothetical protein
MWPNPLHGPGPSEHLAPIPHSKSSRLSPISVTSLTGRRMRGARYSTPLARIKPQHRTNPARKRLETIAGIGTIGAVPREESSGGKRKLGSISKRATAIASSSRRWCAFCLAGDQVEA